MPHEAGQLGPSYDATVMIDIGGDVGALIITTDASMHLAEIEVSPVDGSAARTHVAVRERRGPDGVRYAAIYPHLQEGEYSVWDVDGSTVHTTALVVGGQITELAW
jgi:hypothetical protein